MRPPIPAAIKFGLSMHAEPNGSHRQFGIGGTEAEMPPCGSFLNQMCYNHWIMDAFAAALDSMGRLAHSRRGDWPL
jgi:hypothetical protein